MRKQALRLLCMLLALVMTFSMALTGAPMHVHAAEDIVVTVGASGCDYTTINDALDAISSMSRTADQRAVIEIQPGNYEEMLRIDLDNITLRNASSTPSIALTNKGVDIDANAVRITSYYGHGYNYYSMNSDYLWDADTLASNKSKGSASVTNPGSGSATHWNATVVVSGDNFIAEDIIFENSFNQYVSAKAANDVIKDNGSAKEGSTARGNLSKGSTAVQDKAYVERAAALAIKNKAQNAFFDHCKFVGRQDTLYGGRPVTAAFYDCEIYGACDYIFGGMTAVFAKCDLVFNTSEDKNDKGYITASQTQSGTRGMLFYNCHVTSTTPGVDTASTYTSKPGYLGRPWAADTGEAIFFHTVIDAADSHWHSSYGKSLIMPVGWLDTLNGESKLSGEYGTVELSGVNNSSSRESWATGVNSSGKLLDGSTISVSTFLGSWNPFSGKNMTIVTDGTVIEPEVTTPDATTAPENTTTGSSGGTVTAGSYVHNFTASGLTSDFYTFSGNTSTTKGSVTYDSKSLTTCLKMESSTNISFTAPAAGTLTLVFGGSTSASGKSVKINGTATALDANGILTMDVTASSYTITKGDSINLFYIVYTPKGSSGGESGGEGGDTEETVTATGTLNMSNITVTKAAGAADPTTVDASLLSGLAMTVSYSDGTSATIGLSDLVISNIKSHETLGNYIDVDYNDPITGTKVHCYILVAIKEDSGSEGGGESGGTTTSTHSFDAARDVTAIADKDPIAAGTTYANGYFTVTGTVTQRGSETAVSSVEVGKNATGALQFTVTGTATVEVQFSSTGGTNTSAIGLHDASGNLVANNEGITEVTGASSGKTVVTYTLGAGTYSVVSPNSSYNRGARVYYINVTEQAASGGDAHTHNYVGEVTTPATCTTAGVKTFTCSCGEGTYTETINALGHTEVAVAGKAATCTEKGLTEGKKCSVCGEFTVAQTETEPLGHSYSSVVTAPTCAAQGYTTHTCSTCGNSYVDSYVDAKGHSYTESITTAAACETAGVKTFTCSCGASYTEPIAALGHTAGAAATCTTAQTCTVCNATITAALGHSYTSTVTAPTCTAQGYTTHVCQRGDDTYVDTYVAATGHSYDSGKVTVEASCTTEGEMTYTCTVCAEGTEGHTKTEKIDVLGHDEVSHEAQVPTCNDIGWDAYVTCTRCDYTTYAEKAALGHDEVDHEAKAPTCTAIGWDAYVTCTRCDYTTYAEKAALGHKEKVVPGTPATCTETGLTDGIICERCDAILDAQEEIPALGHKPGETVVENNDDATCTVDGSYDNVVYCTACTAELSRNTVTVDKLGHTEVVDPAVAPTCTATGLTEGKHCDTCGEVLTAQTVVDPLGHDYKNGTCNICGAADPEFVPGVTVSGTYKSFTSSDSASKVVTIELILEGQTEAAYSTVIDNAPDSGKWSIAGVAPGQYTVKVSKEDHVTREYDITVGEENVTDMKVEIWLLGDMDGNGAVNGLDYGNVLRQVKYPEQPVLTDYNRQCADANGDGEITFWDYLLILWHMKGSRLLW